MRTDRILISFSALVVIFLALVACCPGASENLNLAPPERRCQSHPASWQGIIPGRSTQSDVVKILGQPDQKGRSKWNKNFFLYPPVVTISGDSYGQLIVFRDDDIVDWIDVWVSNLDGKFHQVAESIQEYGSTLDRTYVRGRLDLWGPAQIYVWSNCGIAVMAVPESEMKHSADEVLPLAKSIEISSEQLIFQHPVHPEASVQPRPDVRQVIVRKFIFQPTDFASFDKLYADWIPYLSDKHFYRLETAPQ